MPEWHDHLHQGASLLHSVPARTLRWAAVVSVPDALALQTLWQLCMQLQQLDYPVIVLDAGTAESHEAPGLLQLLTRTDKHRSLQMQDCYRTGQPIAVLPSALGLPRLAQMDQPLMWLQPYLQRYALAVFHAPAHVLGALLQGQEGGLPLVLSTPGAAQATQQAYRALKQLSLYAPLRGQICALMAGNGPGQERQARTQMAALQRCAQDYLGMSLPGQVINAQHPQDLHRLALQLLETARTITGVSTAQHHHHEDDDDGIDRHTSHDAHCGQEKNTNHLPLFSAGIPTAGVYAARSL